MSYVRYSAASKIKAFSRPALNPQYFLDGHLLHISTGIFMIHPDWFLIEAATSQ